MRLAIFRFGRLVQHATLSASSVRFGRLSSCEVQLEGDDVARFHAVIDRSLDGTSLELTDLSAGSTKLNGVAVARARLREGDEIRIGRYRILVMADVAWSATPEEMAAEPVTGEVAIPPR